MWFCCPRPHYLCSSPSFWSCRLEVIILPHFLVFQLQIDHRGCWKKKCWQLGHAVDLTWPKSAVGGISHWKSPGILTRQWRPLNPESWRALTRRLKEASYPSMIRTSGIWCLLQPQAPFYVDSLAFLSIHLVFICITVFDSLKQLWVPWKMRRCYWHLFLTFVTICIVMVYIRLTAVVFCIWWWDSLRVTQLSSEARQSFTYSDFEIGVNFRIRIAESR